MHRHTIVLILALALTSCATVPNEAQYAFSVFSFSQCEMPSLMDINNGNCRMSVADGVYRLMNVHPSFDKSFVLLQDESRHLYIIQDKNRQTVFERSFDGVPRYVTCVDIDGDGDSDVVMDLAAYGNHGSGMESFEVLLNERGRLTRLGSSIRFEFDCGQESKAGVLTWYSDPRFCAVFVGEEADVTGSGTDADPIVVGEIRTVKEVWGHKSGQMRLLSNSSAPIDRQAVQHMTFR